MTQHKPAHTLTKEDNARGGRNGTGSLAKQLSHRKKCNSRCPLYPCYLAPIAKAHGNVCVLNDKGRTSPKIRDTFLRIFSEGKDGYIVQMQQLLFQVILLSEQEGSFEAATKTLKSMVELKPVLYPETQEPTTQITIINNPQLIQLSQIISEEVSNPDDRQRIKARLAELASGSQ